MVGMWYGGIYLGRIGYANNGDEPGRGGMGGAAVGVEGFGQCLPVRLFAAKYSVGIQI